MVRLAEPDCVAAYRIYIKALTSLATKRLFRTFALLICVMAAISLRGKALRGDQHQRRNGYKAWEDCVVVRKKDLEDATAPRFTNYPAKVVDASPLTLSPIKKRIAPGRIVAPKDFATVSGVHLYADDFEPRAAHDFWGLRYMPDSKLLIVLGALDEDEQNRNGAFYYVLRGDHFHLVHSTIVKKNCAEPAH